MNRVILPGARAGRVQIPASKSQAHRLLICAAMGEDETELFCRGISRDIKATIDCLNALGAEIREVEDGRLRVRPIRSVPEGERQLFCGESGSTLRFLLPLAGALGAKAAFHLEGRLPQRPLAPLDGELVAHGMRLEREGPILRCEGQLLSGSYTLPGNVSSQYISGLLMALPCLEGDSSLRVTGWIESAYYIAVTESALRLSGVSLEKHDRGYRIPGAQRFRLPAELSVEADWSSAAFFLCIGALSERGVEVIGPDPSSAQGDRAVLDILRRFGAEIRQTQGAVLVRRGSLRGQVIDAAHIPDLIPVLSVVAAVSEGETRIVNASRLRHKESDRLRSTASLLDALGADVSELDDGFVIRGKDGLKGGKADAFGDHRIAMSAAVAACVCRDDVVLTGAEAVEKSYPRFWEDFDHLTGGKI